MKLLCVAVLVALSAMAASADQAVWGPVTGRTNLVTIQRQQYGDIHAAVDLAVGIPEVSNVYGFTITRSGTNATLTLNHYQPTQPGPVRIIRGSCDGSADAICYGLSMPSSAGCAWLKLPSSTRSAITQLLGSCQKSCYLVKGALLSGETYSTENWTCQTAGTANCQSMAGTLVGMRVDVFSSGGGCQY